MDALKQKAEQGGYQAPVKTAYNCPVCRDMEGIIVKHPDGYDAYEPCVCVRQRIAEQRFNSSQITAAFRGKTFENFEIEGVSPVILEAFICAQQYADDFETIKGTARNSIALLGASGSGKTHLLMAVANHLLSTGHSVLYFPWVEGFNEIRSDLSQMDDKITKMQQAEVLFIDDIWKGRITPTPLQIEQIFGVLNYRYLHQLPVLISSERTFRQMADIDEAIASRINEMARDYRVVIQGEGLNYRFRD